MNIKNIAVLTSGGDAPGMNAVVRAVTRCAISHDIKVWGIVRGYMGLRKGDKIEMNLRTVSDIINRGGTILYSARDHIFETDEGLEEAVNFCKDSKFDAVIAIGGDGTLKGAERLASNGINSIFIPATIDNDVGCSEYSIGFDTAMNTAMEMVDKIRDTAQSHEKCSVVEVMGRYCGDIALHTGIAVGATSIIVPEIKCDIQKDIIERIKYTQSIGKQHFIVIISEHCANSKEVAELITKETGIQARCTILGHVQRGGSPTLRDRVMAGVMGCSALEAIIRGKQNRVIVSRCDSIIDIDINEAVNQTKEFNFDLYKNALNISI